jgi:RNA polymerase sigma-70 factor (ECF subfamily)
MMVILLSSKRIDAADNSLTEEYRKKGDKALIGELFNRYSGFVLAICMKYVHEKDLAEELTVEIFESLFHNLKIHKVEFFKTWLYSVSRNHCLLHLRNNKTYRKHSYSYGKEQNTFVDSEEDMYPSEEITKNEEICSVEESLSMLKPEQKLCVELFYLQGKTYTEISSSSGYELKKVKSYIQNGKRNIKLIMEGIK